MKTLKPFLLLLTLLASVVQSKAQVNPLKVAINKVTESYFGVKNALAAEDVDAAADKAKVLLAALNEVPAKRMTPDQSKLWAKYFGQLVFDTRHISEVTRVHHQKEHFERLTTNLHIILTGFKMNSKGV
jgi:hypothetical protein